MALCDMYGIPGSFNMSAEERFFESSMNPIDNPVQLAVPPYSNPVLKLAEFQQQGDIKIDFEHGTTTLGFVYENGICLAADSRATGGSYIGSQTMEKIVKINKNLLGTLAGGAADCVYWDRVLARECRLHELRNRNRISVAAASKKMANIAQAYKNMGLSMGMMLAGFDKTNNDEEEPNLYYIDSEGARTKGKLFSVGSGSLYAYGVLDSGYRYNLTDDEAAELARRSIYHATKRDAYSGGIVRVYIMKKDGYKNVSNNDALELHYDYEEKNKGDKNTGEKMDY